jgi:uncharacterized protein YtpQ (UPF0354 family)
VNLFKDGESKARKVIRKYMAEMPAVGYELENLCEIMNGSGMAIDFSESSLDVLERVVQGAARNDLSAVSKSKSVRTFMLRNRHVIGAAGTFLGCLVIENLGGSWEREDGGLLVRRVGGANVDFDPFEAVVRAIVGSRGRKGEPLGKQYEQLKREIEGTGPRVRFREKVLTAIRKQVPGLKVGRVSGFDVWLTNGTRIHLGNLYAACRNEPGSSDRAIRRFARAVVREASADAEMPPFAQAAGALFPVLKTSAFIACPVSGGVKLGDTLVWEAFHCELVVCFVHDAGDCVRFVVREDLENWDATAADVRQCALDNLTAATARVRHDFADTRLGRAVIINENDGYDAARILLPGLHKSLMPHLGESFVVAVPCRDLLVAFENRKALLALMKRRVRDDAHLGAYGLTDALFVCDAHGTHPFEG